ncbi:MAG: IS630 family transposase [Thermodesulfobacteriota bacterium]
MLNYQFRLDTAYKRQLENRLKLSQQLGKIQQVKRLLAILSLARGIGIESTASTLNVSEESIRSWFKSFLHQGVRGLATGKSTGRPAKLTKFQKKELAKIIDQGPQEAGFSGMCWRSPMIQYLINERYGVSYSVQYISQLMRSMGFSYTKARFESDHLDKETRKLWLCEKWPEIMSLAAEKNAYVLFGDEASFPQWGTLSYTWTRRGRQYSVKTSGKRKSYKVFGLIDYFTGRFFYKCTQERLNSVSYAQFLQEVLTKTRKHIILIQDGAPYHRSKAMKEFFAKHKDRISVFHLPSYSPDYNPIEKLWKNIKKDHTHLCYFPTFDSLIDKVEDALWQVADAPKEVLDLFGFYDELGSKLMAA